MKTREVLENLPREEGISFFNNKKTDTEIYNILVSKGLTDSFDTFVSEVQKFFNKKIATMSKEEIMAQIEGAELTEEQLVQIAGGKSAEKESGMRIGTAIGGGIALVVGVSIASAL